MGDTSSARGDAHISIHGILDQPDDHPIDRWPPRATGVAHASANPMPTTYKPARERLVDDDDGRRARRVGVREVAADEQCDAVCPEPVLADEIHEHSALVLGEVWAVVQLDTGLPAAGHSSGRTAAHSVEAQRTLTVVKRPAVQCRPACGRSPRMLRSWPTSATGRSSVSTPRPFDTPLESADTPLAWPTKRLPRPTCCKARWI